MAAPRATFRIGPLTTYADPAELERWHLHAEPGHEAQYAIGPALGRDAPAAKLARSLADGGTAELFQRRDGAGFRYMIRKIASPGATGKGAAGSGDSPVAPVFDPASPEGRVLAVLREHPKGAPKLSLAQLAEAADLPGRFHARRVLERLRATGVTA